MYYHVKFGSAASKGVRINRRELPKLGSAPLRWANCWWPRHTALATCVILSNIVVLGQTVRALLRRFSWKNWPLASRLSRSLKVIGTNRHRSATYDFILTLHSNHGPISGHGRRHGGSRVGKRPPWKKSGWAWPTLEILAVVWKLPGNSLSMKV